MAELTSSIMVLQPSEPQDLIQEKLIPSSFTPDAESIAMTIDHWTRTTTPMMDRLFAISSYPAPLQALYMTFIQSTIFPFMGPLRSQSKWTPNLTHSHVPFEPSLNIQPKSLKSQVRFTFEPVGLEAGAIADPFNQTAPLAFVSFLKTCGVCSELNTEWWTHFTNELFIAAPLVEPLRAKMPPQMAAPTCFLAFDLPSKGFGPVMKPYLFPHRQALLSRQGTTAVILAAVRKLDNNSEGKLQLGPALEKVEHLFAQRPSSQRMGPPAANPSQRTDMSSSGGAPLVVASNPGQKPAEDKGMSIEMLSFDAISPSESRIKMYARTTGTSFANVSDIWTMDGVRPDVEGVNALKQFWDVLFAQQTMGAGPAAVQRTPTPVFFFFTLEIAPNSPEVDMKLYTPLWTTGLGVSLVTKRLAEYFGSLGWAVEEESGLEGVLSAGHENAPDGGASYTYISFAYSPKKGPYVTLYYAPKPLDC